MRIGICLNGESNSYDALKILHAKIRRAAEDGFASIWMSQLFGVDALTALAVAGSAARVLEGEVSTGYGDAGPAPGLTLEFGTSVVPTYPRHPGVLAQQALTTSLALDGRLTLGIGPSHRVVVEGIFGYSYDRPIRHVREYLDILLPLLEGQRVNVCGETLSGRMGLTMPRMERVPVLLSALRPAMLKLAGERTDGTVLWMTGAATIRGHIVPRINEAAAAVGRPRPRVICVLPICVTDDVESARVRVAKAFQLYGELPAYRAMLDQEGVSGPADVAILGSEEEVSRHVAELADAGATDFVAVEFARGDDLSRTRALLRSLVS